MNTFMEKWIIFFAEFSMSDECLFTDTQVFAEQQEAETTIQEKKKYYMEIAKTPYKEQGFLHGRNFEVKVTEETVDDTVTTVTIQRVTDLMAEHYQASIKLEKLHFDQETPLQ